MIQIFDKKGKAKMVHPVDARELCQSGFFFDYDPTKEKPASTATNLTKFDGTEDISKMNKTELTEFALQMYSSKLSPRFGEVRMRDELERLRKAKEKSEEVKAEKAKAAEVDAEDDE